MTKKSYLSRQVVAAIIITTVLLVAIPLYFFVLEPRLTGGESAKDKYVVLPPRLSGETSVSSSGGVNIFKIKESEQQEYFFDNENGRWSLYKIKSGDDESWVVRGYEATPLDGNIMAFMSNSLKSPYAVSRVFPSAELLTEYRQSVADTMTEEELEKIGGINEIVIPDSYLEQLAFSAEEYGFEDKGALPKVYSVDADGNEHTLYFGNMSPDGFSRYVMCDDRKAVYRMSTSTSDFLTSAMLDVFSANIFVAPQMEDYLPDVFQIEKDGKLFVDIKKLSEEETLNSGHATVSLLYKKINDTLTNIYDTSPQYTVMLYEKLCSDVYGDSVVEVTPTVMTVEDGKKVYQREPMSMETLQKYGIDGSLKFNYEIYQDAKKTQKLVNYLDFSAPQKDEKSGRTFYYVYVYTWDTIVKMYKETLPFIEESEEYYISPFISTMTVDNLAYITIDSTTLNDLYVNHGEGLIKIKERFDLQYQMTAGGTDRVLNSDGVPILEKVLMSDGTETTSPDGMIGGKNENFRRLYYNYVNIKMYTNVEELISLIEKVDLSKPDVTVTCGVYGGGSHTMHFYFFGESGNLCFYTYDNENARYVVSSSDVARLINSVQQIKDVVEVEIIV